MAEWRLFPEGTVPEYTKPSWYAGRERAPHLEQGAHRGRLLEAVRQVHAAGREYDLGTVSDLGAGDGGLLSQLDPELVKVCWGYDLQQTNVAAARDERGVKVTLGDVVEGWMLPDDVPYTMGIRFGGISVCTEMLEHLVDPHRFVRDTVQSKVLVASSPWTETDQNHYEFHTWAFDRDGYRALLEQGGYEIVRHETVDMFQVITGVRP